MWDQLKRTKKPIVLYGMGDGADKILHQLALRQIPVQGVFASDGFVRGQQFHGFDVVTYDQAKDRFGQMAVLLCFGTHRPEVLELLARLDREQELYAPDVPVVGEGLFDIRYAAAHRQELEFVRGKLADKQSKFVFDCIIEYKLTGKIAPLFACQTPIEEAYDAVLHLGSKEHYLDLGAYTGDTICQFLDHVRGYGSIRAVEPDRKNFAKLEKRTAHLPNLRLYPAGIHSRPALLPFCAKAGRNSLLADVGAPTAMESVDHLLAGAPVTYIKIDVEGQESAALAGAQAAIARCRPKLLLSCYHRTQDLFALPMQVLSIRPDYRLYLRHHPCIPAWDTNYYFV